MTIAFELMSNFNAKLKSNLSNKADRALYYGAFALSSDLIEHLMIQLINTIMQAVYSKFVYNSLHN